jgi:hypothetical protein
MMKKTLDVDEVIASVKVCIEDFHERQLELLRQLSLRTLLEGGNPYILRTKNLLVAHDLVKFLLDAYLSSQESSFLEELAIFVAQQVYGGRKSTAEGIDLELEKDGVLYLVSIKSGPNWGNSSQIARMRTNFKQAIKRVRQNRRVQSVQAVNGCCYGRDSRPDKGDYLKLCGQRFWAFISGDEQFYIKIVEPLGHRAREKNEAFRQEYARLLNRLSGEFIRDFCEADGTVDWAKLLRFNSGR